MQMMIAQDQRPLLQVRAQIRRAKIVAVPLQPFLHFNEQSAARNGFAVRKNVSISCLRLLACRCFSLPRYPDFLLILVCFRHVCSTSLFAGVAK
jgi:hypothetical protein